MAIYALQDSTPDVHETAWVADRASVIGKIVLQENSSVWFGAILRGDNETITIGKGSNVQDMVMMHTDMGFPLDVGENCTIGHKAILHGCTIGDLSLVGMGATVLNGAKIGKGCLIGAKALVAENKVIPDYSLVVGVPGRVVKTLTPEVTKHLAQSAENYRNNAARFRDGLKQIDG